MRTIELEIDKIKCIVTNARSYRKKAEKSTSNGNVERYTTSANNHVEKYKDWIVNSNKEDLLVYSKMRGVTFVIADLIFKLKNNPDSANEDWHYMFNLILKADSEYEIENSESVNSEQYIKLIKKYYESDMTEEENELLDKTKEFYDKFDAAMDDDFNTADAISAVFELVKYVNSNSSSDNTTAYLTALKEKITTLTDVLGLIVDKKEEMLDSEIDELIARRQQARKDKNFALADQIRDELLSKGIILEDTREGVRWKRA